MPVLAGCHCGIHFAGHLCVCRRCFFFANGNVFVKGPGLLKKAAFVLFFQKSQELQHYFFKRLPVGRANGGIICFGHFQFLQLQLSQGCSFEIRRKKQEIIKEKINGGRKVKLKPHPFMGVMKTPVAKFGTVAEKAFQDFFFFFGNRKNAGIGLKIFFQVYHDARIWIGG